MWSRNSQVHFCCVFRRGFTECAMKEHNWQRWRQKLSLIQKSELPAVVSEAAVGFRLGPGTEHALTSEAVVDHIAHWRERTQAKDPVSDARASGAPCKVASIDAVDDGRYDRCSCVIVMPSSVLLVTCLFALGPISLSSD
jgi:hypothetical protein